MDAEFLQSLREVTEEGLLREFQPKSPRDKTIISIPDVVSICIGVRRCGKSTLMESLILRLLREGVSRDNILCINFADDRLLGLQSGGWDALFSAYYGRFPEKRGKETVYFFFDEIQQFPHWSLFVERLRREENCRIFITGSSAHLLSHEIATELRGRTLSTELFPFSFGEFLMRCGVPRQGSGTTHRMKVLKAWEKYSAEGGFPAVFDLPAEARKLLHREYLNALMLRDVIERYKVTQPLALRHLVNRMVNGIGTLFSHRKVEEELKALGLAVNRNMVAQYLQWLEDAYFLFTIPVYSASVARQTRELKKVYCVDHAIANTLSNGVLKNRGQMLENMVFVHLRRQTPQIYYYKTQTGFEVDFIAVLPDGEKLPVQVCADMSAPDTRKRELRALQAAMAESHLTRGVVVTEGPAESLTTEEGTIDIIPATEFLATVTA